MSFYLPLQDIHIHKHILGYFSSTLEKGYECSLSQIPGIFNLCSNVWFSAFQAKGDDFAHWARAKTSATLHRSKIVSIGRRQSALKVNEMSVSVGVADKLCVGGRNFPLSLTFFRLV